MHWLTILTALIYSAILAFFVLIQGWELWRAAVVVLGLAFSLILVIIGVIAALPRTEAEPFWQGLRTAMRTELRGLVDLIRFK
ncbi:MAG: hypothetical protein HY799_03310 [Nitrosomonadales bacterium]|nr:hypothetical protein [Nitrosomonadales bacterium]